jgi:hypothetical protein
MADRFKFGRKVKQVKNPEPFQYINQFRTYDYILYCQMSYYSMSNAESRPKDDDGEENDNTVLPQIGEDPGLPADAIEQDSKARVDKEHKQEKAKDST